MQYLFQSNISSLSDVKILKALIECEPNIIVANYSRDQQHKIIDEEMFKTNVNNSNFLCLAMDEDTLSTATDATIINNITEFPSTLDNVQTSNGGSNSSDTMRDITMDSTPPSTPTATFKSWNTRATGITIDHNKIENSNQNNNQRDRNNQNNKRIKNNNNNSDSSSCSSSDNKCDGILNALNDIYDEELVNIIGWAKQIPGFTDLPLNDQMKLLQVSWAEILTLQLAFRSLPFTGKLCFASDIWMDELLAKECGYTEFYYHCVQLAHRLEILSPRREEYYMLKALILANCDTLIEEQNSLNTFRSTILNALNDVVYILRQNLAVSHQQQLLLLLPSLRQANEIIKRFWRKIHRNGEMTLKKLFSEMLEPVLS